MKNSIVFPKMLIIFDFNNRVLGIPTKTSKYLFHVDCRVFIPVCCLLLFTSSMLLIV